MELLAQLSDFVPVMVVAFIFGVTYAVRSYVSDQNDPTAKSPKWFLFVPLGLGFLSGIVHYFAIMDTAALSVLTIGKRVVQCLEMAFGYGGASVIIWELKKKFIDKEKP
jgi:hypothetical protein